MYVDDFNRRITKPGLGEKALFPGLQQCLRISRMVLFINVCIKPLLYTIITAYPFAAHGVKSVLNLLYRALTNFRPPFYFGPIHQGRLLRCLEEIGSACICMDDIHFSDGRVLAFFDPRIFVTF